MFAVNALFILVCLNNLVMTVVSFRTCVNLTCFLFHFFFYGFWYYFIRFVFVRGMNYCGEYFQLLKFYVYWTLHHCDNWRIKDQLGDTCYFISLLVCSTCWFYLIACAIWLFSWRFPRSIRLTRMMEYACMKIQYILRQQNYHNILSELNTTLLLTPSLSVIIPHWLA